MSVEALNYVRSLRIGNRGRKLCLMLIADRADEAFSCFPSVALLAAECEVTERQIQHDLAWFREHGYLSDRARCRPDGSQTSSRYYLHGPWDDFGGTGKPFPQILLPREGRAERWAAAPSEGDFRPGTAAAVHDDPGSAPAVRDQEGCINSGKATAQDGVKSTSSPPVKWVSPPPVKSTSPLEPSVGTTTAEPPAPSGRVSAPDARRASTGSSAREVAGGFAASGSPRAPRGSASLRRVSPEQGRRVAAVVAGLPADLRERLPKHLPRVLRDTVLEVLDGRSVEQLVARAGRRWVAHGYERALHDLDGGGLVSPVGVAVALVRAGECPDPSCEDGKLVDSGAGCRACEVRRADRRTVARGPKPGPMTVPGPSAPERPRWQCVGRGGACGLVSFGAAPPDVLCTECRAEAEEADRARSALEAFVAS